MNIRTEFCWSAPDEYRWSAIDADTYDGAEDSSTRHDIGYGHTADEARVDLLRLLQERDEVEHPERYPDCDPDDDAQAQMEFELTHAWGRP